MFEKGELVCVCAYTVLNSNIFYTILLLVLMLLLLSIICHSTLRTYTHHNTIGGCRRFILLFSQSLFCVIIQLIEALESIQFYYVYKHFTFFILPVHCEMNEWTITQSALFFVRWYFHHLFCFILLSSYDGEFYIKISIEVRSTQTEGETEVICWS